MSASARGVRLREVKNVDFYKRNRRDGSFSGVRLWEVSVSGGSTVVESERGEPLRE